MEIIECWSCHKPVAEAETWDEAYELARDSDDALYHSESGEFCHEACHNAEVAGLLAGMPTGRVAREQKAAYDNYMAEAEYDPVSAYLRAKGELPPEGYLS